jgi:hypothetical protein
MIRAFALAGFLCFCAFLMPAARDGSQAQYVGGTRPDIPANNSVKSKSPIALILYLSRSTRA